MGFKTGNLTTVEPYCKAASNTNLDITVPNLFGYKTGELASKIVSKSVNLSCVIKIYNAFMSSKTILYNLDLSYKLDLDFLYCFEMNKAHLIIEEIWCHVMVVSVRDLTTVMNDCLLVKDCF